MYTHGNRYSNETDYVGGSMKVLLLLLTMTLFGGKSINLDQMRLKDMEPDRVFFNNLQEIKNQLEERDDLIEGKKIALDELKKELLKNNIEIKKYHTKIDLRISSFKKKKSEELDLKVARLMRVFESMKAKNVARIVEELDITLVVEIFMRLKEDRVGNIMRYLTPKKSAEIGELMTEWKKRFLMKQKKKGVQ